MAMPSLIQRFPLQLLSYQDLQEAIDEAAQGVLPAGASSEVADAWTGLAQQVRNVLAEAFLSGAPAALPVAQQVEALLAQLDSRMGAESWQALRVAYRTFLDRIYGALFQHVVHQVPTSTFTAAGQFYLGGLVVSRQAWLPRGRSALQTLIQLLDDGGFRLELEFGWRPLGEPQAAESPRPQRHHR